MTDHTDRELLELAAKASGMPITDNGVRDYGRWEWLRAGDKQWGLYANNANGAQRRWNPLIDDGDALRLAVKLKLQVAQLEDGGCDVDSWCDGKQRETVSECGADPYAATRRAIVRAAAEIGKAMPAEPKEE